MELKVHEFIDTWHNLPYCKTSRPMVARFGAAPFGMVAEHATLLQQVAQQSCSTQVWCVIGLTVWTFHI